MGEVITLSLGAVSRYIQVEPELYLLVLLLHNEALA